MGGDVRRVRLACDLIREVTWVQAADCLTVTKTEKTPNFDEKIQTEVEFSFHKLSESESRAKHRHVHWVRRQHYSQQGQIASIQSETEQTQNKSHKMTHFTKLNFIVAKTQFT